MEVSMKNSFYIIGLYFVVKTSLVCCTSKDIWFKDVRAFLDRTIERPSVFQWNNEMSPKEKKQWESIYQKNPTLFMTTIEHIQEYINLLSAVSFSVPSLCPPADSPPLSEEMRAEILEVHQEVARRTALAYLSLDAKKPESHCSFCRAIELIR